MAALYDAHSPLLGATQPSEKTVAKKPPDYMMCKT